VIKKLKHPFCDMTQGKDTIIAVNNSKVKSEPVLITNLT